MFYNNSMSNLQASKEDNIVKIVSIVFWKQLVIGIFFGLLNFGLEILSNPVKNITSLFFDTIGIVAASFFGWVSGIVSVIVEHACVMICWNGDWIGRLFALCSFTVVVVIQLFYRKREKITFISVVIVYLILMLLISLEGAILSTFIYNKFNLPDNANLRYLTSFFMKQQLPMIFSAFLARIPTNLADKAICTFAGWGLFELAKKLHPAMRD